MSFRSGFLFSLLLIPALLRAETGHSPAYPDSVTVQAIQEIQRHLSNSAYAAADSICGQLIAHDPNDPAGYLFRGVRLLNEMFEQEEELYKDELFAMIDTVLVLAERIRDTCGAQKGAWMSLWMGHAKAHKSLWESRFGFFASALRTGLQAKSEYEKGYELDSTNRDLLFGLGNYHYWKSAKGGVLRSVGIVSDDRDQGIAELAMAAESSLVSREAAKDAMIWIRFDRKEYDSVITLCQERIALYPEGWHFYWPLAQAYYESRSYLKAEQTYAHLRFHYNEAPGNYINLISCDYYRYQCYDQLKEKDSCRLVADQFMEYYRDIPSDSRQRKRNWIDYLRRAARL